MGTAALGCPVERGATILALQLGARIRVVDPEDSRGRLSSHERLLKIKRAAAIGRSCISI